MTDRPLVETARREAILCGVIFLAAITYTITYCTTHGYTGDEDVPLRFVLGFPEWVFYGILCPWAVCTMLAAIFSFVIMKDHDISHEEGRDGDTVAITSDVPADASSSERLQEQRLPKRGDHA